ncbi:MAG: hypothetical protein ABR528_10100 [Pseudonocardiaceae bacterium]
MAGLLRAGGVIYVVEFHPLLHALSVVPPPEGSEELLLRYDFLGGRGAVERDSTFTYTDGSALSEARVSYEWMHGVGEVINALTGAGLRIERAARERTAAVAAVDVDDSGRGRLVPTAGRAPRIPLMYALLARKH